MRSFAARRAALLRIFFFESSESSVVCFIRRFHRFHRFYRFLLREGFLYEEGNDRLEASAPANAFLRVFCVFRGWNIPVFHPQIPQISTDILFVFLSREWFLYEEGNDRLEGSGPANVFLRVLRVLSGLFFIAVYLPRDNDRLEGSGPANVFLRVLRVLCGLFFYHERIYLPQDNDWLEGSGPSLGLLQNKFLKNMA